MMMMMMRLPIRVPPPPLSWRCVVCAMCHCMSQKNTKKLMALYSPCAVGDGAVFPLRRRSLLINIDNKIDLLVHKNMSN